MISEGTLQLKLGLPISSEKTIEPSWTSVCVRNGLSDISQQITLLDKLIKNAWLSFGCSNTDIIPGIRFYVVCL